MRCAVCNRDDIEMLVLGVAVYRLSNRSLATVCMEQRRYLQCWC